MSQNLDLKDGLLYDASATLIQQIRSLVFRYKSYRPIHSISTVKTRDLVNLIDRFQEWPQLLDPYLNDILPTLISTLADCLHVFGTQSGNARLSASVCKLLYTLCKVRGRKVVERFFKNEHQYLRPLLVLLLTDLDHYEESSLAWEEKYIFLLWLAHLITIPFDLNTIIGDEDLPSLQGTSGFDIPGLPKVLLNTYCIAFNDLCIATKAREAAALLLVRLCQRRDVRKYRLDEQIIRRCSTLIKHAEPVEEFWPYNLLGPLTLLSKYIKLIDGSALSTQVEDLWALYGGVQDKSQNTTSIRVCLVMFIQAVGSRIDNFNVSQSFKERILRDAISCLFEATADDDSIVRFTAAKALGHVAKAINSQGADQILDFLLTNLEDNMPWEDLLSASMLDFRAVQDDSHQRINEASFLMADQNLWHGHIMTLAHLLLANVIPFERLNVIFQVISIALNFCATSPGRAFTSDNVRDAACLCVWAISRKCSFSSIDDKEVEKILTASIRGLSHELIQAACFDSSRNIRRAASAALQELVGRQSHIFGQQEGARVASTIDSLSISLAYTAMVTTAYKVSRLNEDYWQVVQTGLFSWRGLFHTDISQRRIAAVSLGFVAARTHQDAMKILEKIADELQTLNHNAFEERHGLLLAAAAIIKVFDAMQDQQIVKYSGIHRLEEALGEEAGLFKTDQKTIVNGRPLHASPLNLWEIFRPELQLLEAARASDVAFDAEIHGIALDGFLTMTDALALARRNDAARPRPAFEELHLPETSELLLFMRVAGLGLQHANEEIRASSLETSVALMHIMPTTASSQVITDWIGSLQSRSLSETLTRGYTRLLGLTFDLAGNDDNGSSIYRILEDLGNHTIEIKCALLRAIADGPLETNELNPKLLSAIVTGLNDYTSDTRLGDIGHVVRLEAIRTAGIALNRNLISDEVEKTKVIMYLVSLAVERIDRVRLKATQCLQHLLKQYGLGSIQHLNVHHTVDTASESYFLAFLHLSERFSAGIEIYHGLVTSTSSMAGQGVTQTSRRAIIQFLDDPVRSWHRLQTMLLGLNGFPYTAHDYRKPERLKLARIEMLEFLLETGVIASIVHPPHQKTSEPTIGTPTTDTTSRLLSPKFYHNIFAATNRAHYQSNDLRLLDACVGVYAGLVQTLTSLLDNNEHVQISEHPMGQQTNGELDEDTELTEERKARKAGWRKVRKEVAVKLVSMGGHVYAKTRNTAADVLYLILEDEDMLSVDFSHAHTGLEIKNEVRRLKGVVEGQFDG